MSEKYDSFQPRRATSIDGFISGAGQRPRQPQFRHQPSEKIAVAPYQQRTVGFGAAHASTAAAQTDSRDELPTPQAYVSSPRPISTRSSGAERSPAKSVSRRQQRKAAKAARKSEARAAKHAHKKKRSLAKRILKVVSILLLLAAIGGGLHFYKSIAKLTGNSNPLSLLGVFQPADLKNDNGRVNILVAGNSADDLGHNGGELTDSIMLLSINTKNNTALMLSIPRDLWVAIPGDGHAKINAAYPTGGMGALKSVVEEVTGLQVHYTSLVNYTAFRDLVSAVGGIRITIDSTDPRGIYDPNLDWTSRNCCALAKYPNGPVTLNGKQALNLARARGDAWGSYGFPDADYTRTLHQRQMLLAIKDKATSTAVIANPLKVGGLVDAVGNNVKTDLQLNEIQTLYYYSKKIDNAKIDSYNINTLKGDSAYMLAGQTIDGQSVQVPAAGVDDFTDIQAQIKKVFTAGPLVKESAGVVILNATDTAGLAKQQKDKLFSQGMEILAVGDTTPKQPASTLIDNSAGKKPNTLAYLKKAYGATVVQNTTLTANYPAADFILLVGANALPKPSPSGSQ